MQETMEVPKRNENVLLAGMLLTLANMGYTQYVQASVKVMLASCVYFLVPALILFFAPGEKNKPTLYDAAAFLWMALVLILKGKRFGGTVDLPLIPFLAAAEGIYLWKYHRGMAGITFFKKPKFSDLLITVFTLGVMWLVLRWLALSLGFPPLLPEFAADDSLQNSLRITLSAVTGNDFLAKWLRKILVTALIEELAYRGIVQNFLEKIIGKNWFPIAIASMLFGISHIGHGGWPYVGLSVLAGLGFGKVYQKTESLSWSIGLHGCFDVLARALFLFK